MGLWEGGRDTAGGSGGAGGARYPDVLLGGTGGPLLENGPGWKGCSLANCCGDITSEGRGDGRYRENGTGSAMRWRSIAGRGVGWADPEESIYEHIGSK